MRKALSLILAVVMVALMIPFAAITSLAADGDVLYSMDFTEWGKENANALTAAGETITVPTGWVAIKDDNADYLSSVSDKGVYLGGAGQGIAMDNVPATNGAHVIKFQWCTEQKIGLLRFGFTQGADVAAAPSSNNTKGWTNMATMAFPYQAGPENFNMMTAAYGTDKEGKTTYETGHVLWHANEKWGAGAVNDGLTRTAEIYDKYGNLVDQTTARTNLAVPAVRGDLFTTYIFVGEDNIVDKVAMEVDGLRYEYIAPIDISAEGRFGIWITNDGQKTSATIKNVAYIDNSGDSFEYPAIGKSETERTSVYYSYDFSDAETLADIPADVYDGANADFVLSDGMLCMQTNKVLTTSKPHYDHAFVLQKELLPSDGTYTVELVLDGSSYFNYLFAYWGDEPENGTATLKEYFNLVSYYKDDVRGNNVKFYQNKGVVNAKGTSFSKDEFSADSRNNRDGNEIRLQFIVEQNVFRYAYVSTVTEDAVYSNHYMQTGTAAIAADSNFMLLFRNLANFNAKVGIKSITVLDGAYCDVDTNDYGTEINHVCQKSENLVDVYDVSDVELTKGDASLRVVENENGIRFSTSFTEDDLQTLVDLVDTGAIATVEVGTLITTTPWATAAGAVTHEALDAIAGDKTAYVEVMATLYDWYAENTFAGTISALKDGREYQAVGFIRITDSMGHVIYIYSDATTATLADVQA